jgi:type IV pilus assembly protein PilA
MVTAIPQTVGQTGDRAYCGDQSGLIKFDPAGGSNCSQNLGQ